MRVWASRLSLYFMQNFHIVHFWNHLPYYLLGCPLFLKFVLCSLLILKKIWLHYASMTYYRITFVAKTVMLRRNGTIDSGSIGFAVPSAGFIDSLTLHLLLLRQLFFSYLWFLQIIFNKMCKRSFTNEVTQKNVFLDPLHLPSVTEFWYKVNSFAWKYHTALDFEFHLWTTLNRNYSYLGSKNY